MITFRGAFLVATAFFTFLLARLTQVDWLYLLDAVFWGLILLSLALPWMAVASLSVRRRLTRPQGRPGATGPSLGPTSCGWRRTSRTPGAGPGISSP